MLAVVVQAAASGKGEGESCDKDVLKLDRDIDCTTLHFYWKPHTAYVSQLNVTVTKIPSKNKGGNVDFGSWFSKVSVHGPWAPLLWAWGELLAARKQRKTRRNQQKQYQDYVPKLWAKECPTGKWDPATACWYHSLAIQPSSRLNATEESLLKTGDTLSVCSGVLWAPDNTRLGAVLGVESGVLCPNLCQQLAGRCWKRNFLSRHRLSLCKVWGMRRKAFELFICFSKF